MNILYYCPEYYSRHGGRTHARGFFRALQNLPPVTKSFLYPNSGEPDGPKCSPTEKSSRGKLWFLPRTTAQVVRFFLPRRELTRKIIKEIAKNKCNAIIIRTGVIQPIIRMIKNTYPDISVCLEINSAYFDESFQGLPLRSVFQRWEVKRFNQADAIVVVSSYLMDYLVDRGINPNKILVNQNGIDVDSINHGEFSSVREIYGIPIDSFLIGYIGGMETFRRLPEVIRYIAKLRKSGDEDIYLLIIGDGKDMPAVKAAIQQDPANLENAVKLLGWLEHSEAVKFLSVFDIAIFPFTNPYCSPLKLFEYLGAGVPTIGPDTPSVREVFIDGTHLILAKQDGSNFISSILELKKNPKLRAELSHNGKQLVLQEYTWERNAEKTIEHIQYMRNL